MGVGDVIIIAGTRGRVVVDAVCTLGIHVLTREHPEDGRGGGRQHQVRDEQHEREVQRHDAVDPFGVVLFLGDAPPRHVEREGHDDEEDEHQRRAGDEDEAVDVVEASVARRRPCDETQV